MTSLTLHIGCSKTGTTAIQRTLRANRALLASNGWIYPDLAAESAAHHILQPGVWVRPSGAAVRAAGFDVDDARRRAEAAWNALIELPHKADHTQMILSSEGFFRRMTENEARTLKARLNRVSYPPKFGH